MGELSVSITLYLIFAGWLVKHFNLFSLTGPLKWLVWTLITLGLIYSINVGLTTDV